MKFLAILISVFLLQSFTLSENGYELIEKFEGLRLKSYKCPAGVWTIGYGHTKTAKPNMRIDIETARQLLQSDVKRFENYVNRRITSTINQNQFDALVDHSFNIGSIYGNLYRYVISGKHHLAAEQLKKYNKAGGKVLNGLVRRANARSELYSKPISL